MRTAPESNYKSIWLESGKTMRFAIDPSKEITELEYPEFYDVKFSGSNCYGRCEFCYMDETPEVKGEYDNVEKLTKFFDSIPDEHMPYQIAYGPEIAHHPEFHDVMKLSHEYGVVGNFTTNGMWSKMFTEDEIKRHIETVKAYCGGVAISINSHLEEYWRSAVEIYLENNIRTNFHIIISDEESVDMFLSVFEEYKDRIEYFVLLPYKNVGRAVDNKKELAWDYFVQKFPKDHKESIAFGALFYPYLLKRELDVKISLYEPETLSAYVELKDGNIYPSSFSTEIVIGNIFVGGKFKNVI